jgi:hypothetical protein
LVDAIDAERASDRRAALLTELFLDPCRSMKVRTVQVVRDTEAAARDPEYVDVLKQSNAKLAEVVDTIIERVFEYRQRLRQRSENVKAGVLRQTKRLVQSLKELQTAARASRVALDVSAREVTDHLLFFLEIAEAAVMDDEAQMLRSAVSDALQCARVVQQHRRGNDSSDADDASTTSVQNDDDTRELSLALETAVGAIRQVVYGVLAGVDGPESTSAAKNTTTTVAEIVKMSRRASAVKKVDSLQPKPLTVSTRRSLFRKSTSVVTGMKVPGAGDDSDSEEHDRDSDDDDDVGDDDDDGGAESEATNGNRSASGADLRKSAHRTTGSAVSAAALNPSRVAPPFSDDDSAALSTIDLLPVEVMMVMGREMTKRTARYRREETSTRAPQLAVMLEKNNTAIGFYSKHFLTTA